MGLYHKIKRVAKLGLVCVAAYYVAKSCNNITFGQETAYEQRQTIDDKVTTTNRDSLRTMDYTTLQRTRETQRQTQHH